MPTGKAELLLRDKTVLPDGSIVEMILWRVPYPVEGSVHSYKYRLYFGRNGDRIIGYDNERGKGDHMHVAGGELPYQFTSVETLIGDFLSAVRERIEE